MPIWSKTAAVAAAALLSIMVSAAGAADITVIASTAMREVMEELVPMFERAAKFLTSETAVPVMKKLGLDPA